MNRAKLFFLRRRLIPILVVLVVVGAVVASLNYGIQSKTDSFAFNVAWPSPTAYSASNPQPNVYLQINYTGTGLRDYTYVISNGNTVLAQGTVGVTHRSPFSVYAFAPVPSTLEALVLEQGRVVFRQDLVLG